MPGNETTKPTPGGNKTIKPTPGKGIANKTHTTALLPSSMSGNEKTNPTPVKGIANKTHSTAVIYTNTYLNTIKKFMLIIMFLMEILNSTWTIQR